MKEHKISLESLATAARQNVEAASKNLEAMNRQADTMTKMLKSVGAQTGLMEKQVIAMQNQANLMQAQFDQWIDLENWTINRKMDSLVIGVDLVNHTAYPITLDEGVLIISENEGMRSMRNDFGETSLSPNQPNHIRFDFGTIIHPDELMSLPSASFKVKGMFSHRHRITNEVVRRPLEGQLQCGPWQVDRKWHIAYTPLVHPNPEPGETEGEQKAN